MISSGIVQLYIILPFLYWGSKGEVGQRWWNHHEVYLEPNPGAHLERFWVDVWSKGLVSGTQGSLFMFHLRFSTGPEVGLESGLNPPFVTLTKQKFNAILSKQCFSCRAYMTRRTAVANPLGELQLGPLGQISIRSIRHTSNKEGWHLSWLQYISGGFLSKIRIP